MKKICAFIFSGLLLSGFLFLANKAYASSCTFTANPNPVNATDNGITVTLTSEASCIQRSANYKVITYPKNMTLKEIGPVPLAKLIDDNPKYISNATLSFILDLNKKPSSSERGIYVFITGKDHPGPWNIVVCLKDTRSTECADNDKLVGSGTINVQIIAPTPTPPPPPQPDQPIISRDFSNQCSYQWGQDAQVFLTNLIDGKSYSWWWNERSLLGGRPKTHTAFTFHKKTHGVDIESNTYTFTLKYEDIQSSLTNSKDPIGHQFCVDKTELTLAEESSTKRRTGANCIWLYFTDFTPAQTACTLANAGTELHVPTPTPLLPQCAKWAYLNGTPVPTSSEPNGTQEKFIRDNGLISSGGIKCAIINTAIGNISTDPAGFVKSIMGLLLGVSGGIAVLLIIISGFKFMSSQGNPEALQGAREQLISAIVGLLFIIFSLVILQIIGVDILRIPGFGE